jgi:hypothetical protein
MSILGIKPNVGALSRNKYSLKNVITELGLTTNLVLCLDVGDEKSYNGGTQWIDTSGGGYNFNRGTTNGSDGADPTFNGSIGNLGSSEYWSFDGADYFTLGQTNPTWVNNLHKSNQYTSFLAIFNCNFTPGERKTIFASDRFNLDNPGIHIQMNTNSLPNKIGVVISASDSTVAIGVQSPVLNSGNWNIAGISWRNTGSAPYISFANGNSGTGNMVSASWYNTNAYSLAQIAAENGANVPFLAGDKLAAYAMWQGTQLTAQNYQDIYSRLRYRFGL